MSRIHEALKKAELERSGAAPVESPAVPFHPQTSKPAPAQGRNADSAIAVGTLPDTKEIPPRELPPREIPTHHDDGILQLSDIVENCAHPNWNPDPKRSVFLNPGLTEGAEQFRTLRSRLYQMRNEQSLETLLITSALPGEGKTFVTSNLGHAIVRQHERRALIVDGDLRRSNLHTTLQAPSSPGLSDYLRGEADIVSVIQQGPRGNLFFIPGGGAVANPSELLANGRLKILLQRVAHAFDWILIDSPPYLPVADANILADACDGVLFVVKARSTPAEVVEKATRELRGRNLLGVVMNGVEERALGYHSRYGSSYYVRDDQESAGERSSF